METDLEQPKTPQRPAHSKFGILGLIVTSMIAGIVLAGALKSGMNGVFIALVSIWFFAIGLGCLVGGLGERNATGLFLFCVGIPFMAAGLYVLMSQVTG